MRMKNKLPVQKLIFTMMFALIILNSTKAQTKHTESFNQVWLGYFNQTRFSNNWGLWADLHIRTKQDFFTNFFQTILRFGLTYYLNDATKLTAGYAYVGTYPGDNHQHVTQPEHRPWQQ